MIHLQASISIFSVAFSSPGILIGSLTAEYGGVVHIKCEKTGYRAGIEFKLKVGDRGLLLGFLYFYI